MSCAVGVAATASPRCVSAWGRGSPLCSRRSEMWTVVRYLHELALAFFLGGQLMLAAVVVPVVRRRGGDDAAMLDMARRFGVGSGIALAVLLVTGIAMAAHF